MLQILEDGELTDAKSRKVDFRNTGIVMTSNIGAKRLTDVATPIGFAESLDEQKQAEQDFDRVKIDILDDLKKHFKPEFLNRIDKVIVFKALTQDHLKGIVRLNLNYLQDRLKQKNIKLDATQGAIDKLVASVRTKLKKQNSKAEIKTIRTRGYQLIETS